MDYTKPPLPIPEQILRLKNRGLIIADEKKAAHYLSNITYYRLRDTLLLKVGFELPGILCNLVSFLILPITVTLSGKFFSTFELV